ncbi:hypothetical protein [Kitasatospora paracochleata]|nr:hypothetical protein [Kitasatospora paracochleata]
MALAIACLLAVTLGYAAVCWVQPFARCRRCNGHGNLPPRTRLSRRPRPCRHCDATGLRLRVGRRIHNHTLTARDHATRIRTDATR